MAVKDKWHTLWSTSALPKVEPRLLRRERRRYEPEAELQDSPTPTGPNVRRISSRRKRDDFDDIFAEDVGDTPDPHSEVSRPEGNSGQMHFSAPQSFNEAQQIADKFKDQVPVILNLQETDTDWPSA